MISIKRIRNYYSLVIKRRQFFDIIKKYRKNPDNFSVSYSRKSSTRRISREIEENITKELSTEKGIIENEDMPLKSYRIVRFLKVYLTQT